jgi:tetratricopeptide (TPR) repeat protein
MLRDLVSFPSEAKVKARAYVADSGRQIDAGLVRGRDPHFLLGNAYLVLGMVQDSVVQTLAAIEIDPESGDAWDQLGWAYILQGRLADSEQAFKRAVALGSKTSAPMIEEVERAAARWSKLRTSSERSGV